MSASSRVQEMASLLRLIREFFWQRSVAEVRAPALISAPVSDPHIQSLAVYLSSSLSAREHARFLHTSSELYQKRLLAAGVADNYFLGPVFRSDEDGRCHAEEFWMCEWYRLGWRLPRLLDEAIDLVRECLMLSGREALAREPTSIPYRQLFKDRTGIELAVEPAPDAKAKLTVQLQDYARKYCGLVENLEDVNDALNYSALLDLIFSVSIQPTLVGLTIVTEFPAEQAALAQTALIDGWPCALRAELYLETPSGVLELANAYQEMNEACELTRRYAADQRERERLRLPPTDVDEKFMQAAHRGIPECAGIALGVDRLAMAVFGLNDISLLDPAHPSYQ